MLSGLPHIEVYDPNAMLALLLLGTALCADVEPLRMLMVGLLIECWHCLHAARMLACLAVTQMLSCSGTSSRILSTRLACWLVGFCRLREGGWVAGDSCAGWPVMPLAL
jgi:hypothetical protein